MDGVIVLVKTIKTPFDYDVLYNAIFSYSSRLRTV